MRFVEAKRIAMDRMSANGIEIVDSVEYVEDGVATFAVEVPRSQAETAMDAMRPVFCVGCHVDDDGFAKVYGELEQ